MIVRIVLGTALAYLLVSFGGGVILHAMQHTLAVIGLPAGRFAATWVITFLAMASALTVRRI